MLVDDALKQLVSISWPCNIVNIHTAAKVH